MDRLGVPATIHAVVGGQQRGGGGDVLEVLDPATGSAFAEVIDGDADLVDEAVQSAHGAFRGAWGKVDGTVRGRLLLAVAQAIRAASADLAEAETLDSGKPVGQAGADVETAARYFEFYAGVADKIYGDSMDQPSGFAYTRHEPHGVVGVVTPWNSPLAQLARSVAPALAAGNAVVVKPSELTPVTSTVLAQLMVAAGLPAGACNVVPGRGAGAGAALVDHHLVRYVSFTGSVATGRAIARAAGDRIVGCSLELGGKSATIVRADADVEAAARAGVSAVVRNAGQSCFATTRLVVARAVHDELVERMVQLFAQLSLGHGLDDPDLGPLVSQAQRARTEGFVERALAAGATVANDLDRDLPPDGFFVVPRLLVGVANDMEVAREEVFGPVQSVLVVDDDDEAVAVANDSPYGLAAGIFTRSLGAAHRLAARLEAGQVQINRYPLGGVDTPFGGYKQSGLGREKGVEALRHYTQLKTVIVHTEDG